MKSFSYVLYVIFGLVVVIYCTTGIHLIPDGIGYWAYLPAVWDNHNLDLFEVYTKFEWKLPLALSETGATLPMWSPGTAVFLTPYHLLSKIAGAASMDRYALSLIFTNFGSTLYGIFACFFIYKSLLFLKIKETNALLATLLTFFGTPLFYYTYYMPNMSHSVSAFAVCSFLTCWLFSSIQPDSYPRYIFLGLILGLAGSVRNQNILYGVFVLGELIFLAAKTKNFIGYLKYAALFFAFALIGFSPQLLVWKIFQDSFFVSSAVSGVNNFNLIGVLFSPFHGILFWTPIVFCGIAGLVLCIRKNCLVSIPSLAVLSLQILVISLLGAWWLGSSFGIRALTNCVWIVGIGVGFVFHFFENKRPLHIYVKGFMSILALWTFILALNAGARVIDLDAPVDLRMFITTVCGLHKTALKSIAFFLVPRLKIVSYRFLVLLFAFLIFLYFVKIIERCAVKQKFNFCYIFVLIYLLFWTGGIVNSHINGFSTKKYNMKTFVSQKDLSNFFLLIDLKTGMRYYTGVGDYQRSLKILNKASEIRGETVTGKELIEFNKKIIYNYFKSKGQKTGTDTIYGR